MVAQGMEVYSTVLWHLKRDVQLAHLAQEALGRDRRSARAWAIAGNCFSLQKVGGLYRHRRGTFHISLCARHLSSAAPPPGSPELVNTRSPFLCPGLCCFCSESLTLSPFVGASGVGPGNRLGQCEGLHRAHTAGCSAAQPRGQSPVTSPCSWSWAILATLKEGLSSLCSAGAPGRPACRGSPGSFQPAQPRQRFLQRALQPAAQLVSRSGTRPHRLRCIQGSG